MRELDAKNLWNSGNIFWELDSGSE